jgi:hypothetical protein
VASSHEIATDVNNPDEINEIFDDITYSKGGSVIRMANYFIGNQTFYKGITVSILIYTYLIIFEENYFIFSEISKRIPLRKCSSR